jgi:hypothetical protein
MTTPAMKSTVNALVASCKGILAADESFPTIEKLCKTFDLLLNTLKGKRFNTMSAPQMECAGL